MYKKEDIKNIHYNNKNEIQFEYGSQIYHYSMDCLKEIICTCWNIQLQKQKYKEVIDKAIEYIEKDYSYTKRHDIPLLTKDEQLSGKLLDILKEVE